QILRFKIIVTHPTSRDPTFISVAEDYGIINELGDWVLNRVIKDARQFNAKRQQHKFYFNISGKQVQKNGRFSLALEKAIYREKINPAFIGVELTETISVVDMSSLRWLVDHLNDIGIDVALDDFGIGYSGIQKLQKLNVQKIKVDKSFLNFKDKRSLSILDYVVKLSKDIGISAMVEGVETPQQQDVLMNFGYQKFQGYLYGKPAMLVA
ncbi:MAG TPA: EAL domain-containing protein, partial [Thiotrichales bacterium]|nr:EAL domain-containing protein [Thiotrichales bacterium]